MSMRDSEQAVTNENLPAGYSGSAPTAPEPEGEEDALVFHEERQTKPVVIVGKDGARKRYLLKEMMSDDIGEWTKFQVVKVSGGVRGRPDPNRADFRDHTAKLISLCLYDESGTDRVPIHVIKEWPGSTLSGLFDYCQTMNGLNDEGREQAKKA